MEQIELLNVPKTEKETKTPVQEVSGSELAEWLGISQAAITQGRNAGFFILTPSGRYDLKASVQAYCRRIRGRKAKAETAVNMKDRLDFLDCKIKEQKIRDWRMAYGNEIAMAITGQLNDILINARNTIAKHPEVLAFLDASIETLGKVDFDAVLMQTEDVTENELADEL